MNQFIITLAAANAGSLETLASEHPSWRLVQKLERTWELTTTADTLDAVQTALPSNCSVRPMVYASVQPPALSVEALRAAVARPVDDKR